LGARTHRSKIQQIGLPLILSDPPCHCIAQAQAGTGKTGTFVLSALGRITADVHASQPQAVILAGTQELVTQIAEVVAVLGKDMGVRPRRVMAAEQRSSDGGGRGRGRGSSSGGGGGRPTAHKADWAMAPGEDFAEQVVVGTPGKVTFMMRDFERGRKPYIDPREVRVLVLDEADNLVSMPPNGHGKDCLEVRDYVVRARAKKPLQLLLFSATYADEARSLARSFVGGDYKMFHEITLRREDLTLDKVDNFYVLVGSENDSEQEIATAKQEAVCQIWESLAAENDMAGQSVLFVASRARAQQLAEFLRERKFEVGQIHGDMDKMEREAVMAEFKENKRPALVATNVLSRGIDNPNVTLVINIDLPTHGRTFDPDPETFVHRIGRSGRWTRRGASISLVSVSRNSRDKRVMAAIERELFANESVDRPLICVPEPMQVGETLKRRRADKKA